MEILTEEDWKVVASLVLVHSVAIILALNLPFTLSDDTEFWLFSTISQSIAALFGFIFAGYAFFRSEVTLDDVDDPEADEILDRLHSKAHVRLGYTSIPAGLAIIGGLCIVALNKEDAIPLISNIQDYVPIVGTYTFYQSVLAVVFSILFVMYIASPNRAQQVVEEILQEESMAGRDVDVGEYIEDFIRLENMLRKIYDSRGGTNNNVTAGQITDYLASEDALDPIDVDRLRAVTRYRNLVVHGEIDTVDEDAYRELEHVIENVSELVDEMDLD